jgi:hypothetical protein
MTESLLMPLMDIFANVFMGLALMIGVIFIGRRWSLAAITFMRAAVVTRGGRLVAYERSCYSISVRGGHRPLFISPILEA